VQWKQEKQQIYCIAISGDKRQILYTILAKRITFCSF